MEKLGSALKLHASSTKDTRACCLQKWNIEVSRYHSLTHSSNVMIWTNQIIFRIFFFQDMTNFNPLSVSDWVIQPSVSAVVEHDTCLTCEPTQWQASSGLRENVGAGRSDVEVKVKLFPFLRLNLNLSHCDQRRKKTDWNHAICDFNGSSLFHLFCLLAKCM